MALRGPTGNPGGFLPAGSRSYGADGATQQGTQRLSGHTEEELGELTAHTIGNSELELLHCQSWECLLTRILV